MLSKLDLSRGPRLRVGLWRQAPAAALLAWLWCASVAPLPRYDLLVFLRAGRQALHGANPYPSPTDPLLAAGHAFVYPYLDAVLFIPLGAMPAALADGCFYVISGLAVLAGCRLAGIRGPWAPLLVLGATTAVRSAQVGSLNGLLFLGCVLCWVWRDRAYRLAVLLVLMVGSKLFLLPLLGWLTVTRRWRPLAWTVFGLALFLGAGFIMGPLDPRGYLRLLSQLSAHESHQGLALVRLLDTGLPAGTARAGCVVAAAGLVGLASRGFAKGRVADRQVLSACLVAALALTPILWLHYLLLAWVPLVLSRPSRAGLTAALLASWVLTPPEGFPPLLKMPYAMSATTVWLLVAGLPLLTLARHLDSRTSRVVPGLREPRTQLTGARTRGSAR